MQDYDSFIDTLKQQYNFNDSQVSKLKQHLTPSTWNEIVSS